MEEACVGRATEGLYLQNVRSEAGGWWSVEACLRVPGLDARSRLHDTGFNDLAAFFGQLAADWRGWDGERVWESLEHNLRLAATHDGHVQLAVQLCQERQPGWSAAAVITLEPGEEMTRAADDVAALLSSRW